MAVPTGSVLPSPQHLLGFSVRYDRRRVGERGCGGGGVRVRIRVREKRSWVRFFLPEPKKGKTI